VMAVSKARAAGLCLDCHVPTHRLRHKRCQRCYVRASMLAHSTPLRRWRDAEAGRSLRALSRETGIDMRRILRIAAGTYPPSASAALILHAATGIPLDELLRNGSA
jgi:hypothetical protein